MIRRLGVNIDHVATVRQARRAPYPDPVVAAGLAELAGADQITCHLRQDRRHIQDHDLPRLRDVVQAHLNVEISTAPEMVGIAKAVLGQHPGRHRVTLVPERPGEVTTEGGLDVFADRDGLVRAIAELRAADVAVSLFVDPDPRQVEGSALEGVDMIELNTARYAEHDPSDLVRHVAATASARQLGLAVAAGHGLTHHNLPPLVRAAPQIEEYNIGHSIVSRAIIVGLDRAVRDIVELLR